MMKRLFCLIWGHAPMTVLERKVYPPRTSEGGVTARGEAAREVIKMLKGYTSISMICPRCNSLKIVEQ